MEKLKQILCEVLKIKEDDLNDQLTMKDIENWDSLKHMDLITSIEESLKIELSMDDIISMIDIKTIRKIVKEKLSK